MTNLDSPSSKRNSSASLSASVLWGFLVVVALGLRLTAIGEANSGVVKEFSALGASTVGEVSATSKRGEELQIGGAAYAVEVAECSAYIGVGPRLARMAVCGDESFAITNLSPMLGGIVTSIARGAGVNYVGTSGGELYALSDSNDGFTVSASIQLPFIPSRMFVAGSVLFVAGSIDALTVLDISQPNQPALLFEYRLAGDLEDPIIRDVTGDDSAIYMLVNDRSLSEHYVYALKSPTGLVRTPEDIKVLSRVLVAGATNTTRIAVNEDRLYAMQRIGQIVVVNTSDRAKLEVLSTWDPRGDVTPGSMSDIAVAQDRVFVTWTGIKSGQNRGRVQVFDQSTIGSTSPTAEFEREDWRPSSIAIAGNRLVAIDSAVRAEVLELTELGVIRELSSVDIQLAAANGVALFSDGSLAVASSKFGLWRVMSTTTPSGLATSRHFPGITHFIATLDDGSLFGLSRSSLFVSAQTGTDLEFVEVTAIELGLPVGAQLHHAYASGNIIAIAGHTQGRGEASGHVTMVDITERTQPQVLGSVSYDLESVGEPVAIVGVGDRLLVAHTLNDAALIDVTDKTAPKIIEAGTSLGMPSDLSIDGNFLAAASGRELQFLEVNASGAVQKISSVTLEGTITAVSLRGAQLYAAIRPPSANVSDWPPQAVVIDATDRFNLRIQESFDLPALATDITASEALLYVATSDAGVMIFTLAEPKEAVYLPRLELER